MRDQANMDVMEIIGFLISLIAFIALGFFRAREERARREHPEEYLKSQAEKEKKLKHFLKSLEDDMEEDEEEEEEWESPKPPPPPIIPKRPIPPLPPPSYPKTNMDDFSFRTKVEDRSQKTDIEKREFRSALDDRYKEDHWSQVTSESFRKKQIKNAYEIQEKETPSLAKSYLHQAPSFKNMVITQIILGPPKGL